jgi:hypothetical protein
MQTQKSDGTGFQDLTDRLFSFQIPLVRRKSASGKQVINGANQVTRCLSL